MGDSLTAAGAITLDAGSTLSLAASNLTSTTGAITLAAAGNVTLDPVAAASEDLHQRTESGFSITSLSNTTTATNQGVWTTTQTGTSVSGASVTVQAGQNLTLTDASLVGSQDVSLAAGGNVAIQNALDTISTLNTKSVVTTGLISSGFNVMLGQTSNTESQVSTQKTVVGSTVGSVAGNLSVTADANLGVTGSSLIAGGNLTLSGQNVTIDPGYDLLTATDTATSSSAGISAGLGGSLGAALNNLYSDVSSAETTTDSRLNALKGVQAAYGAAQLAGLGDANQSASSPATQPEGIQVQVSVGASSSKSVSTLDQAIAAGSSLTAGGNLSIDATAGNLTVTGSTLTAGDNVTLAATQNVTLDAAQNTSTTISTNSSSGWNVGASVGVTSEAAGLGVFAKGYVSVGRANGTDIDSVNTTVTAGQSLTITAGNNVNLIGAQAKGNDIVLAAGNNLNLVSLQDTSSYKSTQQSASANVEVSQGEGVSGGASYSQSNITSNFASVNQQTGLFAGTGGFQIDVGGNTNLTGAVIAAPAANNILTTNTLTFSNILNSAKYSASTLGFSVSSDASAVGALTSAAGSGLGLLGSSGSASGTTAAAISPATVQVLADAVTGNNSLAGLSRDTTSANGAIQPIFNLQQIENNQAVGQAVNQLGMAVVGTVATTLENQAAAEVKAASDKLAGEDPSSPTYAVDQQALADAQSNAALWSDDGAARTALHAAVAGVGAGLSGGNVGGAVAGTVAGDAAAGLVSGAIKDATSGLSPQVAQLVSTLATNVVAGAAGAVAGGAVGGSQGATNGAQGALAADEYNRQLHPDEAALIQQNAAAYAVSQGWCLSASSCSSTAIDEAQGALTQQALKDVDASFSSTPTDNAAQAFLQQLPGYGSAIPAISPPGTPLQTFFSASGSQYTDTSINSGSYSAAAGLYQSATNLYNSEHANPINVGGILTKGSEVAQVAQGAVGVVDGVLQPYEVLNGIAGAAGGAFAIEKPTLAPELEIPATVGSAVAGASSGSLNASLPSGYTPAADGSGNVIGPGNGSANPATYSPVPSALDANGNQIYQSSNGNYYTLTSAGSTRVASPNAAGAAGSTITTNSETGRAAEVAVINNIATQPGLNIQGQVTLTDGTTRCVADCAITGPANATVQVPSGFVALARISHTPVVGIAFRGGDPASCGLPPRLYALAKAAAPPGARRNATPAGRGKTGDTVRCRPWSMPAHRPAPNACRVASFSPVPAAGV